MMMQMFTGWETIGPLLIALSLGYMVLYFANREEKDLRTLGFLIGIVVIAISGLLIIGKGIHRYKAAKQMANCQKMRHMPMQVLPPGQMPQ